MVIVSGLTKRYTEGHYALKGVSLEIRSGEIFALLGPNGAGKTTLINILCGTVRPTEGTASVDGQDAIRDYRHARAAIGLVPQELSLEESQSVWDAVVYSRGLFGKPPDPHFLERVLRSVSLLDKKNCKIMELSGGMKRRVMIAKALSHEPKLLFLDEPTAGVDVELRYVMWELIRDLRRGGVTIVLTTHHIEEAERLADRVGVMLKGEIILVEEKPALMQKFGKKRLTLQLWTPLREIPPELSGAQLTLSSDGSELVYTFEKTQEHAALDSMLRRLGQQGIGIRDIETRESSLEDIFVRLVRASP
jgi:ABC-2 type transport system ATP-binding protein